MSFGPPPIGPDKLLILLNILKMVRLDIDESDQIFYQNAAKFSDRVRRPSPTTESDDFEAPNSNEGTTSHADNKF